MSREIRYGVERGKYLVYINVKEHMYLLSTKEEEEFKSKYCNEQMDYETLLEKAYELTCYLFWENADRLARAILCDEDVKVYQTGRSGGWFTIENYITDDEIEDYAEYGEAKTPPVRQVRLEILANTIDEIIRLEFSDKGILNRLYNVLYTYAGYDVKDVPIPL